MMLFTFIVERAGGTYCSQHMGRAYTDAAHSFVDDALSSENSISAPRNGGKLLHDVLDIKELDGLENVFCTSHLDEDGQLWLINVVKTISSKTNGDAQ